MTQQNFITHDNQKFSDIDQFPGASWCVLSQPVPEGSIHRLKLKEGTVIPAHSHPVDEFIFVIAGTIETGDTICEAGTFWKTPAGVNQGPHVALSDVELMTIRLGPMGEFANA